MALGCMTVNCMSPSSRRAWIEILYEDFGGLDVHVALLAEGVDRNLHLNANGLGVAQSPSSRRAWIEIRGVTNVVPP